MTRRRQVRDERAKINCIDWSRRRKQARPLEQASKFVLGDLDLQYERRGGDLEREVERALRRCRRNVVLQATWCETKNILLFFLKKQKQSIHNKPSKLYYNLLCDENFNL